MNINADEFDDMVVEVDVAKLSELADMHADAMDGMIPKETGAYVREIVASCEFVFAVWRTPAPSGRTGLLCIKGVHRMVRDLCSGVQTEGITTAIPARDRRQALALKRAHGDRLDS
jgi:hypothetical protein